MDRILLGFSVLDFGFWIKESKIGVFESKIENLKSKIEKWRSNDCHIDGSSPVQQIGGGFGV